MVIHRHSMMLELILGLRNQVQETPNSDDKTIMYFKPWHWSHHNATLAFGNQRRTQNCRVQTFKTRMYGKSSILFANNELDKVPGLGVRSVVTIHCQKVMTTKDPHTLITYNV